MYLSPVNVAEIRLGLELLRAGVLKQKAASSLRRLRRKPQLRITVAAASLSWARALGSTRVGAPQSSPSPSGPMYSPPHTSAAAAA